MSSDEESLFFDEMSDVVPLKREGRVRLDKSSSRDSSLDQRRCSFSGS